MGILIGLNFDVGVALPIDSKQVVLNLTARDALLNKYEGLKTYVIAEGKNYQLVGGASNTDWVSSDDVVPAHDHSGLYADLVNGLVPSTQLPSYVDDILEYASYALLPVTGDAGKIYVTTDTNLIYRWSGTGYAETSTSLALGETSSTAYRGDRGKTAYDHSLTAHQVVINGSGFVKADGTTITFDNSSYQASNLSLTALAGLTYPGTDQFIKMTAANTFALAEVSVSYTNAVAMPETIHGYAAGTTFLNKTMAEMWTGLLYPYQVPTFTAFAVTGFASIIEAGVDFTGGAQTFSWTLSNAGNVTVNSIAIRDITNDTDLLTGLANDGSEAITLTAGTRTGTGETRQWGIRATDSNSNQIGYRYITTYFYSPFYYGVGAAALDVAGLQALTKSVSAKSNKAIAFTSANQKFYYAYPASYGNLTSIVDQNGYNITSAFTMREETFTNNAPNYNGISVLYKVYESNALSTMGPYTITFNF